MKYELYVLFMIRMNFLMHEGHLGNIHTPLERDTNMRGVSDEAWIVWVIFIMITTLLISHMHPQFLEDKCAYPAPCFHWARFMTEKVNG